MRDGYRNGNILDRKYEVSESRLGQYRLRIRKQSHDSKSYQSFQSGSFPTYRGLYIYLYLPYTSAVNKTVNYPGDLPRGRATVDKSDCFNGISIRGRLYVYSMYTLWGSWMYSRHIGRFTSNQCEGNGRGWGRTNTSASN